MPRRRSRLSCTVAGAAALTAALAACGPDEGNEPRGDEAERYADAVCSAIESCECFQHFGTTDFCSEQLAARFADLQDAGLELDLDCFEGVVDNGRLDDCSPIDKPPSDWQCTVLQGEKQVGELCSDHTGELVPLGANECAVGLRCAGGTCQSEEAILPPLTEGDDCFAEQAYSCGAGGLYCSPDGACMTEPKLAEQCVSPFACEYDGALLFCKGYAGPTGIGVCTRQANLGEPCDPLDWTPCQDDNGVTAWCNSTSNRCEADGPAICLVADFPKARPSTR